jgi:hypothetical protein
MQLGDKRTRISSWPGLSRPSTSLFGRELKQDVDARHKAGHDGEGAKVNKT